MKDRCELRCEEAIKGLQQQIDDLRHDPNPLLVSRRMVLYREVIFCVYSALEHNSNNPRGTTLNILSNTRDAFGFAQGGVTAVLGALDPRPNQSWIKLSNEAHGFSVAEAEHLINDGARPSGSFPAR